MKRSTPSSTARLDQRYVWHPFTQMKDWLRQSPIVIAGGQGSVLWDDRGREYLDANSSIWTNLHGHNHPSLNRALQAQSKKIAHSSALGFANIPASELAERLIGAAPTARGQKPLSKVFFSDDGSTAMEVALKLSYEFARRTGHSKPRYLTLQGSYHGDTVGAVSLGHIDLFHKAYRGLLFRTDAIPSPYCYRCPFNRAQPERADARVYRRCQWECVTKVEQTFTQARRQKRPYTAFSFEPRMQGAAGMIPQPDGWLGKVCGIAREAGAQLIADEVMTAFGRTGIPDGSVTAKGRSQSGELFASAHERVVPDYVAVAKGLTGGYLPMAATLVTQEVFDAFLGEYEEFRTFFHGHSFTGNQLGAALANESLRLLDSEASRRQRARLEQWLRHDLATLWDLAVVGDVRQVGLVVGIELVRDWKTRAPFQLSERAGIRVCNAMAKRGVLTRPIGSVVVLMPPYCTTRRQVRVIIEALRESIEECFGSGSRSTAANARS